MHLIKLAMSIVMIKSTRFKLKYIKDRLKGVKIC